MTAGLTEAWAAAEPVTADRLKDAASSIRDRKEMAVMLERFPAVLESVFSAMNPIKSRVTMMWAIQSFARDAKGSAAQQFHSRLGPLDIWIDAERDFDALLCELAFGGSGIDGGDDEGNRPVSKLEKILREHVFQALADAMTGLIGTILEAPFERLPPYEGDDEESAPTEVLEIRYLLNAFSHSSEINVRLPVVMLETLLQDETMADASKDACLFHALGSCDLHIRALLPAEEMDLPTVLYLKPGDVLALGISASSPVSIICEDELIFAGEIRPGNGVTQIVIQPPDDAAGDGHSGQTNQVSEELNFT